MTDLLTAAQMRAIEQTAIASGEVTGLELMERAGAGVVDAVFAEWPELGQAGHSAVVLCGPGNNGGDGFVVARLLHALDWTVEVYLYGDPEHLPPDAKENCRKWGALGETQTLPLDLEPSSRKAALVVDALFGTGLTRPVEDWGPIFLDLNGSLRPARMVSVDLPSGLCSDSGKVLIGNSSQSRAACVASDLTVSFHDLKLGHVLQDGPAACGKVVVKDIGLKHAPDSHMAKVVSAPHSHLMHKTAGHKYGHGHALILTGGFGKTGAARLAAQGALRIGAGLVTLGVPGSAQMEVASQITALMMRRVDDGDGLADVLKDPRINALCLGPGLGHERARGLVPAALAQGPGSSPGRGVVLDADALSAFGDAPEMLFEMLPESCVLTPHGGEFARLFPDIAAKLNATPTKGPAFSKVDATREAAARAGCIVLFKGPDTVIADPEGRCSVNAAVYDREAPWLATAGSGDVLAGFITGLLARGIAPMQAAETAAWLHVECARSYGPGLIAEDLPEMLPKVLRTLSAVSSV